MRFFRFLFSRYFIINVLIAVVLVVALSAAVFYWLGSFTRHGETIAVPDLKGMVVHEAAKILEQKKLRFQVIDSLYDPRFGKGAVLEQEPKRAALVKEDRTIYLTINASAPPKVKMPNLIDLSLRQASSLLESVGLKTGTLTYVPDIAFNAVLDQQVRGRSVEPGEMITKGTTVDLILGRGANNETTIVPDLRGLTVSEASEALVAASLNLGAVVKDKTVSDSLSAVIYKQVPSASVDKAVPAGSSIDIFLTQDPAIINKEGSRTSDTTSYE